jgi:predicted Zn-dependent peptidase
MTSIGVNEMVFNKYKSVEEIIAEIDAVSAKSVQEFIQKYFDLEQMAAVLMGGGAKELEDWFLNERMD